MQKYAILLRIVNFDQASYNPTNSFIANTFRPYFIPIGEECEAYTTLKQKYPEAMIVIADKETILNNPFDIVEDDFEECLTI